MLAFRTVQQRNHRARDDVLYELKAGPGVPDGVGSALGVVGAAAGSARARAQGDLASTT
jgi:hypothetical protein